MTWHHVECWSEGKGCGACGRHLRFGLRADPEEAARRCPGCAEEALEAGAYEDLELVFCAACWGSWVPLASLGPLLLGIEPAGPDAPPPAAGLARERLVPCFACALPMEKWLWRGLTLDCCPGHGLWLDSGELLTLRALAGAQPAELYQLLSDLRAN